MRILEYALVFAYALTSAGLFLYGMNSYVMLGLFFRGRRSERAENARFLGRRHSSSGRSRSAPIEDSAAERGEAVHAIPTPIAAEPDSWPRVTTQLPIYNERYVVERLISAVVRMDYPGHRHEIQVLDDSDDETVQIVARVVDTYRSEGVDIVHIRRPDRQGFKAGALNHGTALAKGEYLAVFDADFVPPPDFLLRTVPFFFQDPAIAMVQTRWGHVNRDFSLLTRAQAVGIDGHFVVEQGARTWNGLYMNFNGTAGVWRRAAIVDAGGWEADTLTEDLDLSYRAQLAGWKMKYLPDVITPAEIPVDINGLKSQQHRWAKGSIQTAMKILPRVFRANIPIFKKIQAVFHLTHYLIHPLMFASALFSLPAILAPDFAVSRAVFLITGIFLILSTLSPTILYLVSQREAYPDWRGRVWVLPVLVAIGVGIAVNNSRAVLEAVLGRKSDFVRTPKYGALGGSGANWPDESVVLDGSRGTGRVGLREGPGTGGQRLQTYRISPQLTVLLELAMALYGFFSLYLYVLAGRWPVVPFLLLSSFGFLVVGVLSIQHGRRSHLRVRPVLASAR